MVVQLLFFGTLLFAAFVAKDVVFLGFFAVVVSILLSFPINLISKFLPRGVAVIFTLLALLAGITSMVLLAFPVVSTQAKLLKDQVPMAAQKVRTWVTAAENSVQAFVQAESLNASTVEVGPEKQNQKKQESVSDFLHNPANGVMGSASKLSLKAFSIVINFAEFLTAIILVGILAAFLVTNPDGYRDGVRIFIPKPYERQFDELWHRLALGLKHWVGGIFIEMLLMGTFAGIGLWLVGIDGALVLGLLTFLATFVPYLGAILSSIPGLLMGLAKSPQHLLYAAGVYLCVHILEGYILSPFVMKQAIRLRPGLLLFWQALMGTLFGAIGVIVATPLLACLKAFVGYTYVECKLGKSAPRV